jgi:hypothetical protein
MRCVPQHKYALHLKHHTARLKHAGMNFLWNTNVACSVGKWWVVSYVQLTVAVRHNLRDGRLCLFHYCSELHTKLNGSLVCIMRELSVVKRGVSYARLDRKWPSVDGLYSFPPVKVSVTRFLAAYCRNCVLVAATFILMLLAFDPLEIL